MNILRNRIPPVYKIPYQNYNSLYESYPFPLNNFFDTKILNSFYITHDRLHKIKNFIFRLLGFFQKNFFRKGNLGTPSAIWGHPSMPPVRNLCRILAQAPLHCESAEYETKMLQSNKNVIIVFI